MTISPRHVFTASLLVTAALVWALVNKPFEGRTLLRLTPTHGLTVADLASVAAVILAVAVLVVGRGRKQRR